MNGKNQFGKQCLPRRALLAVALAAINFGASAQHLEADHREFEATLYAPYAAGAQGSRSFALDFSYPFVESAQDIVWRLELLDASGRVVQRWQGVERLTGAPRKVNIDWAGRSADPSLADGIYTVRMVATAKPATTAQVGDTSQETVDALLAGAAETEEQKWDIMVGEMPVAQAPSAAAIAAPAAAPAPVTAPSKVKRFAAAAVAGTGLPAYTVYFGNLHSQTNHSDGGGNLASCTGAQNPQSGTAGGPTEAYTYAMNKGLDFLMASEHNHMFDGSDSTNANANASTARALFQSGLTAATNFNAAHPTFLGVYGLEWGVISNGGHMNIFNTTELLGWESNSSGQLIGDTYTPKGDYAGLYSLMAQRGWVGQFNHPSSSGQFLVNGVPLGYTADGDTAMAMCEVLNTSAFSTNTTETETGRSSYEGACNKALEAGFHVAFTTDQDNHCANWGASYTNRTGVLIPTGTPLSNASFIAALKERRVFATMDKASQLIFTANGHVMGERFYNTGPLNLAANFSNSAGKSIATVAIYEGVPGRNGTVSVLANTASTSIVPAYGEHFYYAKLTQSDGNILWSAPVWVTQTNGTGDYIKPTVSASVTGTSGNITLAANASDDTGVTTVEFYVDNALIQATGVTPYSATLDSTTLSNGNHRLIAKAYDAANNVGTSTAVTFAVNNVIVDQTAPVVAASETGRMGSITLSATATDNVGVTKVEFYVDGSLAGSSVAMPYALALDSKLLTNGSHTVLAKAYDAANNIGSSSAFAFTIDNPDTSAPVAQAAETGTSGIITLSAPVSDNVGVTKVEFYVDGALKGTSLTAPYSLALNSTQLSNGAHSLVTKAYDAAGNVGASAPFSFSVNNSSVQLILNGGFESGATKWTASAGVVNKDPSEAARTGTYKAWLNGVGTVNVATLAQKVTIASTANSALLSFWLRVTSDETGGAAVDTLQVQVRNSAGAVLATLATYSNLDKGNAYVQKNFDLTAFKGQAVTITFVGTENDGAATSFIIDDVSVNVQ
ncbi:MAG: Ig-like domain-containing protein [Pseudomonadota bacterium]|nr:Ig-like domain-containing protein [Pseudomonadota bacterium]